MIKFIELTTYDNAEKFYLNINNITAVNEVYGGSRANYTAIEVLGGRMFYVNESTEKVIRLIKDKG